MGITNHQRYIKALGIICLCCISYFLLYSSLYRRHDGVHHGRDQGKWNTTTRMPTPTRVNVQLHPANLSQHVQSNISKTNSTAISSTTISTVTLSPRQELADSKVILLWTFYYNEKIWKLENDFTRDLPNGRSYFKSYCPHYDCYITNNKAWYNYSHAIIFHDRNILQGNDRTMPKYRSPWQRWVFYNIESPRFVRSFRFYADQLKYDVYNWSMTYLNNSHIDARYGYIVKRIEPTRSWMYQWPIDYHGRKKQSVAWLVSHCLQERLTFVRALSRHIPINIYGACGVHRCQHKSNLECWKYEITQYKFYLAFENSVCADYITEKFWYPLRYGVIPVVLGGGRYRKIAPPNSYIDVDNFPTIKALASYLNEVAKNKTLYNSYMDWRQHWEVIIPRHWCNLCSALHTQDSSVPENYHTFNDDFGKKGQVNCKNYPLPKV